MSPSRREHRALARVNRKAKQPVEEAASPNSSSGVRSFRFAGTLLAGVILGTGIGFWMSSGKKIDSVPAQTVSKEQDHAPLTLGRLTELTAGGDSTLHQRAVDLATQHSKQMWEEIKASLDPSCLCELKKRCGL